MAKHKSVKIMRRIGCVSQAWFALLTTVRPKSALSPSFSVVLHLSDVKSQRVAEAIPLSVLFGEVYFFISSSLSLLSSSFGGSSLIQYLAPDVLEVVVRHGHVPAQTLGILSRFTYPADRLVKYAKGESS